MDSGVWLEARRYISVRQLQKSSLAFDALTRSPTPRRSSWKAWEWALAIAGMRAVRLMS
jgi:hypothetical protein